MARGNVAVFGMPSDILDQSCSDSSRSHQCRWSSLLSFAIIAITTSPNRPSCILPTWSGSAAANMFPSPLPVLPPSLVYLKTPRVKLLPPIHWFVFPHNRSALKVVMAPCTHPRMLSCSDLRQVAVGSKFLPSPQTLILRGPMSGYFPRPWCQCLLVYVCYCPGRAHHLSIANRYRLRMV